MCFFIAFVETYPLKNICYKLCDQIPVISQYKEINKCYDLLYVFHTDSCISIK